MSLNFPSHKPFDENVLIGYLSLNNKLIILITIYFSRLVDACYPCVPITAEYAAAIINNVEQ